MSAIPRTVCAPMLTVRRGDPDDLSRRFARREKEPPACTVARTDILDAPLFPPVPLSPLDARIFKRLFALPFSFHPP